MPKHVAGKIKEIIFAHFEPNEDLMIGVKQVVVERNIEAGVVMSITGGLVKARLSWFPNAGPLEHTAIKIYDLPGPFEASGHGIIGKKKKDGSPYVHIHIDVTNGNHSIMGHLEEGTLVRSLYSISHFTIAIASVDGFDFHLHEDEEMRQKFPDRFPVGVLYHDLIQR